MTETRAPRRTTCCPRRRQFEKGEATFFNFEFPRNFFHLRRPLLDAAPRARSPSPRSTPGSSRRSARSTDADCAPLRAAAAEGRCRLRRRRSSRRWPPTRALGALAPILLYRTLGPTLPDGAAAAAVLLGRRAPLRAGEPGRASPRAGFDGEPLEPGEQLFDAILASPSGRGVRRRRVRRDAGARPHARRRPRSTSRCPSCSTSSTQLAAEAAPRRDRRVPVRPLGRRAPLVHREHDHPRPASLAKEDAGGAADAARRRRAARRRGRRARPPHAPGAAAPRCAVEVTRHDAARPHLAAERARARLHPARRRRPRRRGVAPNELTAPEDRDSSPARRGTSTCRRAWSGSPRRQARIPDAGTGRAIPTTSTTPPTSSTTLATPTSSTSTTSSTSVDTSTTTSTTVPVTTTTLTPPTCDPCLLSTCGIERCPRPKLRRSVKSVARRICKATRSGHSPKPRLLRQLQDDLTRCGIALPVQASTRSPPAR